MNAGPQYLRIDYFDSAGILLARALYCPSNVRHQSGSVAQSPRAAAEAYEPCAEAVLNAAGR